MRQEVRLRLLQLRPTGLWILAVLGAHAFVYLTHLFVYYINSKIK